MPKEISKLSIHNRSMPVAMKNLKDQSSISSVHSNPQKQPPPPINKGLVWMHCNKCFEFFVKKERKFVFLSCQHVLCILCLQKYAIDGKRTCPFCKKTVTSLLIEDNMPIKFKKYFHPKPWETLSNFNDVVPFQMRQRDHFIKGCEAATEYASKMEMEKTKLREKLAKSTIRKKSLINIETKLDGQCEKLIKIKDQCLLKRNMNKENLYKQSLYKQVLNKSSSYSQNEKLISKKLLSESNFYKNFKPTDTSSRISRV